MTNTIRALRNLKGYTQEEVAMALGINNRTFCYKERNPDKFTVREIKKLAEIFEVKEEIFFTNDVTVKVL